MKKSVVLSGVLLLAFSLWNCETDQNGNDDGALTTFIRAEHYYVGRRAPSWDVIHIPSIWARGQISGSSIPNVDYVDLSGIQYGDPEYFFTELGYTYFSPNTRIWSDTIPEPIFDPLTVRISSDIGEIEGSVSLPDTIETLSIDAADTIPVGTAITISWTGGEADFYDVGYYHNWMPDEWTWLGYSRDTIVTGNSVTLDGSYFPYNGLIEDIYVVPMCGPFPEIGAEPNMVGDGYGYLYFENQDIESDRTIAIGEGINLDFFFKPTAAAPQPEDRSDRITQKIKSRIGY